MQAALDGVVLSVGGERVDPGGRVNTTAQSFLTAEVALLFGSDGDEAEARLKDIRIGVEEAGVDVDDVELLVVGSTGRLKLAEVLWQVALEDAGDDRVVRLAHGTKRPDCLRSPFGGCRLDLYVCLRRHLPKKPLRPSRKGTWLGRCQFTISTDLGEIGFTPIPLDEETRDKLGLSSATLRYAEIEDPLDPDTTDDSVRLYVDAELLALLAMSPTTSGSKSFQRQLYLDAMTALVIEASRLLNEVPALPGIDQIEGSLLDRLLNRAVGDDGDGHQSEKEALMHMIRDKPMQFIAQIETWVPGLKKGLSASISETVA